MTRKTHNKILEAIAEGSLTAQAVAEACLAYMSEDDVADMAHCNDFFHDGDDDQMQEEGYNEDTEDPRLTRQREYDEMCGDRRDMWRREY